MQIHDAPSGAAVGPLQRPLLNSHEEIHAESWIAVRDPSRTTWVARSDLAFTPAPDAPANFIDAVNAAHRARVQSDFLSVRFTLAPSGGSSPTTSAALRLSQDDHWQEYRYEIAGGVARPVSMVKAFGPAESLKDLPRVFYSFLAAIASALLASLPARRKGLASPAR